MQAQHFKHYEIKASLGEGGFGQVFEAWDKKLCRSVALKRLKNLGAGGAANNLIHEARMGAALEHAAFVKVHAIEDDEDSQTIVMELVRGQTLKQILQTALPPVELALDIVQQIAQAMQVAHASGLVHGDLKPSNLILDPNGKVRILDFGLASQADPQATTSLQQADPQGTISYMAPERLMGAAVSVQTDVYALGVILYELLTGHRPFAELNGLALAAAHMQSSSEQWPFPAELPAPLRELVCAMCARECGKRLLDMQAVINLMLELHISEAAGNPFSNMPVAAAHRQSDTKPVEPVRKAALGIVLSRRLWWLVASIGLLLALFLMVYFRSILPPLFSPQRLAYSESHEMQQGLLALRLFDRPGNLLLANQHFETILQRTPQHAAAAAGQSLVNSTRYFSDEQDEILLRKAQASVQQALQINDQLALAHVAQARILLIQGKLDMALAAVEQALHLAPNDVLGLHVKFDVLFKRNQWVQAKELAKNALARYPQEKFFADALGQVYFAEGNLQEAEKAFRLSIKIEPDAVVAYANLSAALLSQARNDEALQILQMGLQIRPSSWLYTNLGNALFAKGDYVGAATAFEHAVSNERGNPAFFQGWANLGDTLLWLPGRRAEARLAYEKARQLLAPRLANAPNDADKLSRMGVYSIRVGDAAQAMELSQRAINLSPKNAVVQFRAALAFELCGNRQLALKAIGAAIQLGYPQQFIEIEPDLLALRRDSAYPRH